MVVGIKEDYSVTNASSIVEEQPLILMNGNTLAVFDRHEFGKGL